MINIKITPLFTYIPGATTIVHSRGIYKQAPVFVYNNNLYAGLRSGYVRLYQNGGTSVASTQWGEIVGVDFTKEYNGLRISNKPTEKPKLRAAK